MSRDDFADRVADAIRRSGSTEPVAADVEKFIVTVGSATLNLANQYAKFCGSNPRSPDFFDKLAASVVAARSGDKMPTSFDAARARLLPVVRNRYWLEDPKDRPPDVACKVAELFAARHLTPHLCVHLVYDVGPAHHCVMAAQLAEWRVTFEEAFRVARDNLAARPGGELKPSVPGTFLAFEDDAYVASTMLLTDRLRRLALKGDPVVFIPTRGTLLVTGTGEPATTLIGVVNMSIELGEEPYSIQVAPLRLVERRWVEFTVPPTHPGAEDLRFAWLSDRKLEYESQAVAWDEAGTVPAGTVLGEFNIDDGMTTSTVWRPGQTPLLPKADRVLCGDERVEYVLRWDELVERAGSRLTSMNSYPERWRPAPGTYDVVTRSTTR